MINLFFIYIYYVKFLEEDLMVNAYVYKVTNTVTGQYYFGYRYRNQKNNTLPSNDLWLVYFTSSKQIHKDLELYGKSAFITEIIYEHPDSIECWKQEQQFISEHAHDPLLINKKWHDPESGVEKYRRFEIHSEKTKKKMSDAGLGRKKTDDHRKKISLALTGRKRGEHERLAISLSMKGKTPHNKGKSPPKFNCSVCGKFASRANLKKWHESKCKLLNTYS